MTTATQARPATTELTTEWVDPATLLIDANTRLDPRLDADFIASIRELGVLQPVIAVRTAAGELRARLGHRRALGAMEAGRSPIPVTVVADEATGTAADIERIVAQYVENTHRAGYTAAEEVGVVAQLFDLGLTAAQVRKRTRMPKPVIAAARAVAGSEVASAATRRWEFLTITQAAVIAEFESDVEALKLLATAARKGEGAFDHTAQQLRDTAAERAVIAETRQRLEAEGVTVSDERPSWQQELRYLADGDGGRLTEESHRGCPGHTACLTAVRIPAGSDGSETAELDEEAPEDDGLYTLACRAEYFCADPEAHGHPRYTWTAPTQPRPRVPEEDREQASAERRRVINNNKAWRSAETVRRRYLTSLAARKNPPAGTLRFIVESVARSDWQLRRAMEGHNTLGCELLGLPSQRGSVMDALATATDSRAQVIALTLILAAYEEPTGVHSWRNPDDATGRYLTYLASTGYELSDTENLVLTGATTS